LGAGSWLAVWPEFETSLNGELTRSNSLRHHWDNCQPQTTGARESLPKGQTLCCAYDSHASQAHRRTTQYYEHWVTLSACEKLLGCALLLVAAASVQLTFSGHISVMENINTSILVKGHSRSGAHPPHKRTGAGDRVRNNDRTWDVRPHCYCRPKVTTLPS
jgi:hypothetical protein